ncbi:MAG: signal peptidase II [Candidatus Margulisiibacteriota bacterium]
MIQAYYLLIILIIAVDQASKYFVSSLMLPGRTIPLINNVFHITFVRNTGAAFGIFPGNTNLLIAVGLIAALFILYTMHYIPKNKYYYKIGLSLILAGSIGNIIDRLYRGYVVDMLDFRLFPVFNVADAMINIGMVILIAGFLLWRRD